MPVPLQAGRGARGVSLLCMAVRLAASKVGWAKMAAVRNIAWKFRQDNGKGKEYDRFNIKIALIFYI